MPTGEQVHTYNSLPFKGPVTCVAYHPFDHVVAMCGLGGRTVSVICFTDREAAMLAQQQQQATATACSDNVSSSPRSVGSGTLIPPAPVTLQPVTRRKLLQKSMTVDSQSTIAPAIPSDRFPTPGIGSGSTAAAAGSSRKSKQSSPSRKFDPRDMSCNTTATAGNAASSGTGSRMRRAMKRLEIALLMKSLDRS